MSLFLGSGKSQNSPDKSHRDSGANRWSRNQISNPGPSETPWYLQATFVTHTWFMHKFSRQSVGVHWQENIELCRHGVHLLDSYNYWCTNQESRWYNLQGSTDRRPVWLPSVSLFQSNALVSVFSAGTTWSWMIFNSAFTILITLAPRPKA